MTDNEIIKAYGCCNLSHDECGGCDNCPLQTAEGNCLVGEQEFDLEREVFNLLNRQKAEIERLAKGCGIITEEDENWYPSPLKTPEEIKAEAVKEFAEMLKNAVNPISIGENYKIAVINWNGIDNLVKEMVGEG